MLGKARSGDGGDHRRSRGGQGHRAAQQQHRLDVTAREVRGCHHVALTTDVDDRRGDLTLAGLRHDLLVAPPHFGPAADGGLVADADTHQRKLAPVRAPPVLVVEQIDQRRSVDVRPQRRLQRLEPRRLPDLLLGRFLLRRAPRLAVAGGAPQERRLHPRLIAEDGTHAEHAHCRPRDDERDPQQQACFPHGSP
jgi:hypothetical protein